MNPTFEQYAQALHIENLSQADQVSALTAFAKAVHNQFLLALNKEMTEDHFNAVTTSINLGPTVYVTTLKHLYPDYLSLFEKCKQETLAKINA